RAGLKGTKLLTEPCCVSLSLSKLLTEPHYFSLSHSGSFPLFLAMRERTLQAQRVRAAACPKG
ncbi:MAG: hypothetical protein LH624_06255, partial [Cryobacterium sp.]|nr:hypothetical protein [Cryobacterium sp.]